MITSYQRLPDGSVQSNLDEVSMRAALADRQGTLWVDLESASREEGEILERVFGFHHLTIDDCYNEHIDPAKIDDYGEYIFVIGQAIELEQERQLEVTELDLYLGANYVVSFHAKPLPFIETLRRRCEGNSPELAHGADFLAHALLDRLVDDYQPAVEALDDVLSTVEELVLDRPEQKLLHELLVLKRNIQRLRRTIIPQRDVVNRFARGEFPQVVRPETYMYYRDIYDHIVRVEQLVESVRDLADGVLSTYLSSVNNRMNDVMKTLSVVATIILPLTFIASIYGMNFENMPELEWKYGYFMVLAAMFGVAVCLVVFFRLRRWF